MKPEARVFEITSPTKEITIISIYNQFNLKCTAHGYSEACESCEEAIIDFKSRVFEIHLVNQQVVFHWVSNSSM